MSLLHSWGCHTMLVIGMVIKSITESTLEEKMVCVSFYFQVIIHKCLIAQMYVHQVDTCCPQGSEKDIRVSAAGVTDIWVLGSEPWASTTAASTVNCWVISRAS